MLFSGMAAPAVPAALKALRFSGDTITWVGAVVQRWSALRPSLEAALEPGATDAALRRLIADTGRTRFTALMRLASARWNAQEGGPPPAARVAALYRRGVRIAFREPVELADLAVNGDDLREAGLPPGPALGQILRHLLDAVIEDPARNTREHLLALARHLSGAS